VMQSHASRLNWTLDRHSKKKGMNFSFTISDRSIHAVGQKENQCQ
jgi:hypothetical protein